MYFNSKNKDMEEMKFYTEEEALDKVIGEKVLRHVTNMKMILLIF